MEYKKRYKLHIDTIGYDKKPSSFEFSCIKPRLQNESTIQELTVDEMLHKISHGYTISPAVMKGTRASDWIEQQVFMVDIDNSNSTLPILTLNDALDLCHRVRVNPTFYYHTFNSSKEIPRYRLVFLINEPVKDINIREKIMLTLINMFPQSDKSGINADRIFLGTNKGADFYNYKAELIVDDILKVSNMDILESKETQKFNDDNELNELKRNFDLLSYMCKDNETHFPVDSQLPNRIVYFESCSVCGHQGCLRYYPQSNSFYCFGANGSKGGSIIDYLMYTENLTLTEAIDKLYELSGVERVSKANNNKLVCNTVRELQNKELAPITYYVKDILPQGLALLCSLPKIGKSWLSLDLCLSISKGQSILGFETTKATCLYLALEDSENRLKERLNKLLNGEIAPDNFYYSINSGDISNGLINQLEDMIKKYPDLKVIVIDTLQKIRGTSKSSNVYANDYSELGKLKSFADKNKICILLVHHLRKGSESSDIFERVSGTNGITGTADTTIVLNKKTRDEKQATLSVVGRDVEYNEFIIQFNKATCKWEMICNTELQIETYKRHQYDNNKLVILIRNILKDTNSWNGTMKELNETYKSYYDKLYIEPTRVNKLGNELKKLKPQLLEYDKIEYTPAPKNPIQGVRPISFKKNE